MQAVDPTAIRFEVARVWVAEVGTPRQAMIRIGPVADDVRWVAQRIGRRFTGCWLAEDYRTACQAVESWLRRYGGVDAWRELERPAAVPRPNDID